MNFFRLPVWMRALSHAYKQGTTSSTRFHREENVCFTTAFKTTRELERLKLLRVERQGGKGLFGGEKLYVLTEKGLPLAENCYLLLDKVQKLCREIQETED